jgi:hypothetical protein
VKASRPLRDQRADFLNAVGYPIADCVPAKPRSINAMTGLAESRRQTSLGKGWWRQACI